METDLAQVASVEQKAGSMSTVTADEFKELLINLPLVYYASFIILIIILILCKNGIRIIRNLEMEILNSLDLDLTERQIHKVVDFAVNNIKLKTAHKSLSVRILVGLVFSGPVTNFTKNRLYKLVAEQIEKRKMLAEALSIKDDVE